MLDVIELFAGCIAAGVLVAVLYGLIFGWDY